MGKVSIRSWLVLLALLLIVLVSLKYRNDMANDLAEYCSTPGAGAFSMKLACIPRRDQ